MRVKLSIPERDEHFKCSYKVRVSDLNYGNHMGIDRFLTLAHEARLQFFDHLKMDEMSFFGEALIMSDSLVQYKSQGFRGDQLEIKIWVENISGRSFDLYYAISKEIDKKTIEVARIKTGMVFFNYDEQKIVKTPKSFLEKFEI